MIVFIVRVVPCCFGQSEFIIIGGCCCAVVIVCCCCALFSRKIALGLIHDFTDRVTPIATFPFFKGGIRGCERFGRQPSTIHTDAINGTRISFVTVIKSVYSQLVECLDNTIDRSKGTGMGCINFIADVANLFPQHTTRGIFGIRPGHQSKIHPFGFTMPLQQSYGLVVAIRILFAVGFQPHSRVTDLNPHFQVLDG